MSIGNHPTLAREVDQPSGQPQALLQDLFGSPMGAAIRHSGQMCPPLQHRTWERKEWVIEKKVPKTLTQFTGAIETYVTWYERVRDHLVCSHEGWGRILDLLERENGP